MTDDGRWNLVWTYRDALLTVARRRTPSVADAEDCVSEAMLRTVLHPDLDATRVGAFLTSVTVRLCADLHRDRTRAARVAATQHGDDRLVATPEALVCDRVEASRLAGAVARSLSPLEHAAVRARAEGVAPAGVNARAANAALTRARVKARLCT